MVHPPQYATFSMHSSVRPSVRHTPYLRNRTSSNRKFWYTCVKWWYLQEFFFSFFFEVFFGGGAVSPLTPQYATFSIHSSFHPSVRHTPCLRNRTSSNCKFWYTCVKWWYLQEFFFLFFFWSFFFFWAVRGVKGQKIAQNQKKNTFVMHHMSGTV